jgi:hypothetical protein
MAFEVAREAGRAFIPTMKSDLPDAQGPISQECICFGQAQLPEAGSKPKASLAGKNVFEPRGAQSGASRHLCQRQVLTAMKSHKFEGESDPQIRSGVEKSFWGG